VKQNTKRFLSRSGAYPQRLGGFLLLVGALFSAWGNCHTAFANLTHPFYVSVTEIHYNPETQAYEVAIKLFADDLERGLETLGVQRGLPLGKPGESPETDSLLVRYLRRAFSLEADGQLVKWRYLGREQDLEAVWVFVEAPAAKPPGRLKVRQAVLTHVLPDQKNMVHVTVDDHTQTLVLMEDKLTGELEWE